MLSRIDREDDAIGFRARGRIQLDARTATAYGLLRSFVRFEITRIDSFGVYWQRLDHPERRLRLSSSSVASPLVA